MPQQESCYNTKRPSWGNPPQSKAASDIIIVRCWHGSSVRVRSEMEIQKKKTFCSENVERAKMKSERGENRWRTDKSVLRRLVSALCCAGHGCVLLGCAWRSTDCWAQTVTHMTCRCRPAPAIQPFVVPHWAVWQWSAKQQWQRGPTIRMANLLMHQRADSLTFLFTSQRGCKGGTNENRERGGKKKETKFVFPSIILLYLAHTVVLYKMPLSRLFGFLQTATQNSRCSDVEWER